MCESHLLITNKHIKSTRGRTAEAPSVSYRHYTTRFVETVHAHVNSRDLGESLFTPEHLNSTKANNQVYLLFIQQNCITGEETDRQTDR